MTRKILFAALATLATASWAPSASAQVTSNKTAVALTATVVESIAVVVATPAIAFGDVVPGASNSAPLGQTISCVTTWNLALGRNVKMYAYFSGSTALLGTLNGGIIPVSAMTGSVNGGTATAFSTTNPFSSGSTSLLMWTQTTTAATLTDVRTDTLGLTMNLASITLANDAYTGTMYIQVQAV